MADTFSKKQRSAIMQKVKSNGNKSTEQKLIAIFKANGITGWRRHYPATGKPDFVFIKQKIAVFADGCFWHGHQCRNIAPKQNADYWNKKLERNILRDRKVTKLYEQRGWTVVRFWECEIKPGNINLKKLFDKDIH